MRNAMHTRHWPGNTPRVFVMAFKAHADTDLPNQEKCRLHGVQPSLRMGFATQAPVLRLGPSQTVLLSLENQARSGVN